MAEFSREDCIFMTKNHTMFCKIYWRIMVGIIALVFTIGGILLIFHNYLLVGTGLELNAMLIGYSVIIRFTIDRKMFFIIRRQIEIAMPSSDINFEEISDIPKLSPKES